MRHRRPTQSDSHRRRQASPASGLGGTPQLELYICYRKVKQMLDERNIRVGHSFVGEFFTGLEMAGFSVTLMKLDAELKELLTAPADTPCYKVIG